MQEVRHKIGMITAIVNQNRQQNTNSVYIKEKDYYKIDDIKLEIINLSNEISKNFQCNIEIKQA